MKTAHCTTTWLSRHATSAVVSAIVLSTLGLAGCGPQAAAPAVVVAPAPAPVPGSQVMPGTVPVPQSTPQAQAPDATAPAQVAPAPAGITRHGQPVPTAPADDPNAPVTYAPPVQAPPVQRAPARHAAHEARPAVASNRLGRVSSVEPIREKPAGTGAGGVLGGVIGGLVGNRFGGGNGRTALTVLGAAGGAVAGNSVERNVRERIVAYRVSVELDNGDIRSYQQASSGDLQVGDRVRVDGQRLRRL